MPLPPPACRLIKILAPVLSPPPARACSLTDLTASYLLQTRPEREKRAVRQLLGQHARATADLQHCLPSQLQSQHREPCAKFVREQKLIEPAAAMRAGNFELRVTGLIIVLALAGPPNERKII